MDYPLPRGGSSRIRKTLTVILAAATLLPSPALADQWRDALSGSAGVDLPPPSISGVPAVLPGGDPVAGLEKSLSRGASAGDLLAGAGAVKAAAGPAGRAWIERRLEARLASRPYDARLQPSELFELINALPELRGILAAEKPAPQTEAEAQKGRDALKQEALRQADLVAGVHLAGYGAGDIVPVVAPVAAAYAAPVANPVAYAPKPPDPWEESAIGDRLAQRTDLAGPGKPGELADLDALVKRYEGLLTGEGATPGYGDDQELRRASLEALKEFFGQLERSPSPAPTKPPLAGTPQEKRIAEAVARVEARQAQLQGEVAARDAAAAMLGAAEKTRGAALRERRNGREMLEFRKNFSRLAMVMDLSYSLNLLENAERALAQMQKLLDDKLAKIEKQRKDNAAGSGSAAEQEGRVDEWKAETEASVAEDKKMAEDFKKLANRSESARSRVEAFRTEVDSLLQAIDARDKGRSANAVAEYERRLALLPQLQQNLIHGSGEPGSVNALTLDYLKAQSGEVAGYLRKLADADSQLASAPLEFAGALVVVVPGIPEVGAFNPSVAQVRAILAERRVHWKQEEADHQKLLDGILAALDPSNTKRVANDFGDFVPESLVVYEAEQKDAAARARRGLDDLAAKADALSARIEAAVPGASLPRLSGRTGDELRDLVPQLADATGNLSFPDSDAGFAASMDKLELSKLLPFLGDLTVRLLEAEATVKALDKPIRQILPSARTRFTESVAALHSVVSDIAADEAYLDAGLPSEGAQALIDRKRALLRDTLKPMLENMQGFLDRELIPFQEERIADADPASGEGYGTLYKEKKNLFIRIRDGLNKTLPWGLASGGAKEGDVAGARANIETSRKLFLDYQKIVVDLKDSLRRRKDPNNTETEDVYGEQAPYSLVKRKEKYQAEMVQRAGQINARGAEVNKILGDMDALFPGKYNLASRFKLPTDIRADDPNAPAKLRAMVDGRVLQNMAAEIQRIADEASAQGSGDLAVGGGGGLIPTGNQPPLTLANNQQLALLGLEAVKRIVPTTATGSTGDSVAECVARFLFSEGLVSSSEKNLRERIPMFETYLAKGETVLNDALADLDADSVWVGGDLSGGLGVLDRKVRIYNRIRDTAQEGVGLFLQKAGWSAEGYETISDVQGYYESLGEVYGSGSEALDAEEKAAREMKDALKKKQDEFRKQKETVVGWLAQLNDPHESALNRVMQNVSRVQDQTKAVLEANIDWHQADKQFKSASEAIAKTLEAMKKEQAALSEALDGVGDLGLISPDLAKRVRGVSGGGTAWLAAQGRGPQTLVIPKSQFATFLSQLFSNFEAESSARDIAALREEILKNPASLAQLLPNSKMVEVGEGAEGFYLVYQSEFSTPYGLETNSQVTLGNVLRLGENNVSVIGHRFASPPDVSNAPFGDQGITVRVESLQGDNWVNYLDVTFHKFIQDIPKDLSVGSQAQEARMMVFDDFAVMMANGKLYFGAAGFADFAVDNPKDKPYYYGGNVKAKIKFTEVMSLNAEESVLFAKDPRKFLQTVNLDFTGYDPDIDEDFVIGAEGQNKFFRKDKLGLGFDLQKALEGKDTFNLEIYGSQVSGTDDIAQKAVGLTVVKGFSFDVGSVPVQTTLTGGAELGERYNTYTGKVAFNLPNQGLILSAQGKILGDADTYFFEVRKKMGANTEIFASYGSPYVGLNHRLTLGTQTTFTLGELWRAVAGGAAQALTGDETLKGFNESLDGFFKSEEPHHAMLKELEKVFASDVGRRLLSLEVGTLTRDLKELQKAGAILDNTRMRAIIGFVSNSIGGDTAERAAGGGFQLGTQTDLTMTKSQKGLLEAKTASIYEAGLRLQVRLLELTKAWQQILADLALARWEMGLSAWVLANCDDQVLKAEAHGQLVEARGRYRQAALRYNALTGRGPEETVPFDALSPVDLDALLVLIHKSLARQDRLSHVLTGLAAGRLAVPEAGFNLMDWIPWVESLTFTVGTQLQDLLSNQFLMAGVSVRLPVWDPTAKHADRSFRLTAAATLNEMAGTVRRTRLKARAEREAARAWRAQAAAHASQVDRVIDEAADAIRAGRNGLMPQSEVWARLRRWHWTVASNMEARVQAGLFEAWAVLDDGSQELSLPFANAHAAGPAPRDMNGAVDAALKGSENLEAVAQRSAAAAQLMEAADRRFAKVSVDLTVGVNITAAGVALMPALGITGLSVYPIINVDLNPSELQHLATTRHAAEATLYERLGDKVSSDLALELFTQYAEYRAAEEAVRLYDTELIPALEAQSGTQAALELQKARAGRDAAFGRLRQARATLNYLMGQPLDMPIALSEGLESSLAGLSARFQSADPVSASRDVLASRVKVARAVETVVDKNLKTQHIRVEPISLIGRSLGRLVAALGGDGMASPELMALARHQVLQAERDLEAYDKALPALRARLAFEIEQAQRDLDAIGGSSDPRARLAASQLRHRLLALKAQLAAYGGGKVERGEASFPRSYAALRDALRDAFADETPSPDLGRLGQPVDGEPLVEARGTMRYYHLKQTLGGDPVGKNFVEGWVEARLRSASTPPEALIALARLQEEKADQLYSTELALSRAKADMLLARVRLMAEMLPFAEGAQKERIRARLERDFRQVAAHLRLSPDATLETLLAAVPAEVGEGLEGAASRYLADAAALDLDLLRRSLFQEGLPEEVAASRDPLPQLRANIIAERMSYKGFTPVAAFGLFRGMWVSAAFLEAPDPEKIQKSLENVLTDALRRELESQDRLKTLALKLHSLMASVADKLQSVEAMRARLTVARRNLLGCAVRAESGLATAQDLEAARDEALAAHETFVSVLYALRMDFVALVTELKALGHDGGAAAAFSLPGPRGGLDLKPNERGAREELLAWWSRRLLDEGFEARQEQLLAGVPESLRAELRVKLAQYRQSKVDADGVMQATSFEEAEVLDLLMRNDLQGRRQAVEAALSRILEELSGADPSRAAGWAPLMAFLRREVDADAVDAGAALGQRRALRRSLDDAYWSGAQAPKPVEAAYRRVSALQEQAWTAKEEALAAYLKAKLRPEDYVLRDAALERYVRALLAYDAALLEALKLPDVAKDPRWARALDGAFGLRSTFQRQRDLLRHGRGLVSLDAALEMSETRLRALAWSQEDSRELAPASEAVAFLRDLRRRWVGRPDEVDALLAVRPAKPGQAVEWVTRGDVDRLAAKGRVVEVGGERWLLGEDFVGRKPTTVAELEKAGARRIEAGVDARREELKEEERKQDAASRKAELSAALKLSPFALTRGPEGLGRVSRPLDLAELRGLERQGRVLYFLSRPDRRTGVRLSVPSLAARWRDPADLTILVQVSGPTARPDRYPSLEALAASPEAEQFERLEIGRLGAVALLDEARGQELQAARAGWLSLKLEGFAFARDKKGALAAVYMNDKELAEARKEAASEDSVSHGWTFHLASDLRLALDDSGLVVAAEGPGFSVRLGEGVPARWIAGELFAVETDARGRVARAFLDRKELERESEGWWLEDTAGRVWKRTDADISPTHRLRRYIDPSTGLPVNLGRAYLARRLDEAEDELGDVGRWAYMPWNWHNIVLEIPRGIVKTPVEMITGRDPNQEGYIGRVYMYQGEGGATVNRGVFGTILHGIDIFEILPDPVDRYFDPSQYPDRVDPKSPIKPGEWIHEKKPTTVDGEKKVHFGKGALIRSVRYAKEDQEDARARIMGFFSGSVRRTFVETVRGRDGSYEETTLDHKTGRVAVETALVEAGGIISADGEGSLSADPGHIAVDRVTVGLEITVGAEQQKRREALLEEYIRRLEAEALGEPGDVAGAKARLDASEAARRAWLEAMKASAPKPGLPGGPVAFRLIK